MATNYYDKNVDYVLKTQAENISISVITGSGQGGSYVTFKGQAMLGSNENVAAGTANNCNGETIKVIATIQDKLAETNWTSVLVIVNEGNVTTPFAYAEEVPNNLDIACYTINIAMTR